MPETKKKVVPLSERETISTYNDPPHASTARNATRYVTALVESIWHTAPRWMTSASSACRRRR